jgi:hypothetical protein
MTMAIVLGFPSGTLLDKPHYSNTQRVRLAVCHLSSRVSFRRQPVISLVFVPRIFCAESAIRKHHPPISLLLTITCHLYIFYLLEKLAAGLCC